MKKDVYKRFEIIEGHLPVYRSELYKLLEANEQRILVKVKEIKDTIEGTMLNNFQAIDDRIDRFTDLVDSNLEILRTAQHQAQDEYLSRFNTLGVDME